MKWSNAPEQTAQSPKRKKGQIMWVHLRSGICGVGLALLASVASAQAPVTPQAPMAAPVTAPAPSAVSETPSTPDLIQPNGDWERFPFAPHVPIGLSFNAPFGSIDGGDGHGLGENAGTFTNFELGVGLRVRRVVVDLMFAVGGAGMQGPLADVVASQGFDPSGVLHIFAGLDAAYYVARTQTWAPWVGGRIGYDGLSFSGDQGEDTHLSYMFGGFYLAARAGADWRVAPAFGLGPFIELGVGRFSSGSVSVSVDDDPLTLSDDSRETSEDLDLEGGAMHGYLGGGLRLVFFP